MDILDQLENLQQEAAERIREAASLEALHEISNHYIGRKGIITDMLGTIGSLPAEQRPLVGKNANIAKKKITALITEQENKLNDAGADLSHERIDVTAVTQHEKRGSIHPIAQVQAEMERIFQSMGFQIVDGPHVECEYYNFEALNIPADHPAREHQDTFWLTNGLLLRTHTSSVQVRTYLTSEPPLAVIIPGRVFRYEAIDASHENTFNQIEGFMIDRDISIPNLIAVLKEALRQIFKKEITVRLRPGFFPFVEPGYELDFQCLICAGKGCAVCKRTGWVEFLGCGMIHPNVLRHGNIDPDIYTGFAFGMGLDRLTMMRYGINDIRVFQGCDLRALHQFKSPSLV